MAHRLIAMLLLLTTNLAIGQNVAADDRRYISVTGSAEVVVAPDEIELEIILREHKAATDLSKIEERFITILKQHNIDDGNIILGNATYYWYYWWRSRKDFYQQKTFKVQLDSSTDFLALVKALDIKGVHSLRIAKTSNTELQKLRKEVKIAALKAAKEKATYLLESIDEKVGKVISIEELTDNPNHYWRRNQNLLSNAVITTSSDNDEIENVTTIKLRYEVKAKFEIE